MKVKICGNMRLNDALAAAELGADFAGVLVGQVHASKNFIEADLAARIAAGVPPSCMPVMVTHMTDLDAIVGYALKIKPQAIQLHGDSQADELIKIREMLPGIKLIKTIHVEGKNSIKEGEKYFQTADALLLDTAHRLTGQIGGTGITHDWSISRQIVEISPIPVILAGGLTPENVSSAIAAVSPYGVDVNSGVKGPDGFKDYEKLKRFIENAKKKDPR